MPLSKVRDRDRKRLIRLESRNVQPKVVIPGLEIKGNEIVGVTSRLEKPIVQPEPVIVTHWVEKNIDADGNPMPEVT